MAVSKRQSKTAKTAVADREEKVFKTALENLEKAARDRILAAHGPFNAGIRMADEIRRLADRVEDEVRAQGISLTEASYTSHDAVGVGIGVL